MIGGVRPSTGIGTRPELSREGSTLTVRAPIALQKRGGRKLVVASKRDRLGFGAAACRQRHGDSARPRLPLEADAGVGRFSSLAELAGAEKINTSYLSRMLRLILLAPGIGEAMLDGRQPADMQLDVLLSPCPVAWEAHWASVS